LLPEISRPPSGELSASVEGRRATAAEALGYSGRGNLTPVFLYRTAVILRTTPFSLRITAADLNNS
jgi:hypothetical protein